MIRQPAGRSAAVCGILLALSAAYLVALLVAYLFGLGAIRRHHVESASYIFTAAWLATALARRQRSAPAPAGHTTGPWVPLGLFAAAAMLYGNTVSLGLFSDDFVLLRRALDGEWLEQAEFVRPFPLAAWQALFAITEHPAALHLLNIGLHGLNAVLVCLLALRLGLRPSSAAAAGALFVAFPGSVEAVVWPAAVHDLLVAACALVFVLLAGRRNSVAGIAAAMFVLVAGLLSKESAIAIPVLAAAMWVRRGSLDRTPGWPVLLGGVGVCVIYVVIRTALVTVPGSFVQPPTRYMLKELASRPIGTLMLPWTTAVQDSWPAIPLLWVAGCVAAAAAYAWSAKKALPPRVIVGCLLAVFVAVLPVYTMLFITPDLENARYLYLSTAFWVVALAGVVSSPAGLAGGRALVLGAAIAAGAIGVQLHLTAWREGAALRERVLTAADSVLESAGCSPVSFAGAPDSVRGAYVFRNGLAEAIAFHTGAAAAPPVTGCTFEWTGSGFQASPSHTGPVQATFAR